MIINQYRKLWVSTALILSSLFAQSNGASIIFDLNGVLLQTNKISAFGLFWKELLAYTTTLHNPLKAKKRLFEILDSIKPLEPNALMAEDGEGMAIPQLIRDWLTGSATSEQLIKTVEQFSLHNPQAFSNAAERALIIAIAKMMFTPERFVLTQQLIPQGMAFAKICKNQGHQLFILSNWDAESFELILQRYPELFALFDGIVTSGAVGLIKPDPVIYDYIISRFNLNPAECIFIDDQPHNVAAASTAGIYGILCPSYRPLLTPWSSTADFDTVRKQYDLTLASMPQHLIGTKAG